MAVCKTYSMYHNKTLNHCDPAINGKFNFWSKKIFKEWKTNNNVTRSNVIGITLVVMAL